MWRSHPSFESFRLSFHGGNLGKKGGGGKGKVGQGLEPSFCICYLLLLDHLPNANAEDNLVYAKPMTLFFFFASDSSLPEAVNYKQAFRLTIQGSSQN